MIILVTNNLSSSKNTSIFFPIRVIVFFRLQFFQLIFIWKHFIWKRIEDVCFTEEEADFAISEQDLSAVNQVSFEIRINAF